MGTLKSGATYIYESHDGITYAREFGADPSTRIAIGYDYRITSAKQETTLLAAMLEEERLWREIFHAAKTNITLHEELERVKMLYYLCKDEANSIMHHPV